VFFQVAKRAGQLVDIAGAYRDPGATIGKCPRKNEAEATRAAGYQNNPVLKRVLPEAADAPQQRQRGKPAGRPEDKFVCLFAHSHSPGPHQNRTMFRILIRNGKNYA
jgi:hypothetical protein